MSFVCNRGLKVIYNLCPKKDEESLHAHSKGNQKPNILITLIFYFLFVD